MSKTDSVLSEISRIQSEIDKLDREILILNKRKKVFEEILAKLEA